MKDAVELGCEQFMPERDFPNGNRGFPGYLRFVDINRSSVKVVASSAAMRHCIRVFITPHPDYDQPQPTPSGIVHPATKPAALHLCRGMAKELIDALQRFLDEPVDPGLACEDPDFKPEDDEEYEDDDDETFAAG